jgi:crotonobetainyl-CoA:carnitine CoA-transferase CaiB-like acyl-CoA transferase
MSQTPPEVRWMPRYGEHTGEVYAELGFSSEELEALRSEGVCE